MSVENGRLSQNYDSDEVYCSSLTLLAFTFMFGAFNRHFCPKCLPKSTFVTRKNPQHITVDKVRMKK